jgi:hypothetical protein
VIDLTILAVVVAIRITLSWSLSQEVDRHSEHIEKKTVGDEKKSD